MISGLRAQFLFTSDIIQCESHLGREGATLNFSIESWKEKEADLRKAGFGQEGACLKEGEERQSPRPRDEDKCMLEGTKLIESWDLWMCACLRVWLCFKKQSIKFMPTLCFTPFFLSVSSPPQSPSRLHSIWVPPPLLPLFVISFYPLSVSFLVSRLYLMCTDSYTYNIQCELRPACERNPVLFLLGLAIMLKQSFVDWSIHFLADFISSFLP